MKAPRRRRYRLSPPAFRNLGLRPWKPTVKVGIDRDGFGVVVRRPESTWGLLHRTFPPMPITPATDLPPTVDIEGTADRVRVRTRIPLKTPGSELGVGFGSDDIQGALVVDFKDADSETMLAIQADALATTALGRSRIAATALGASIGAKGGLGSAIGGGLAGLGLHLLIESIAGIEG